MSKYPLWVTIVVLVAALAAGMLLYYLSLPPKPEEGVLSVHFIDVGQGDCQLLHTSEGTVLIDSGTTDSQYELTSYLQDTVRSVDYFFLTHPHEDHIGGAAQIIRELNVKKVIMPDAVADSAAFDRLLDAMEEKGLEGELAEAGAEYSLGGLKLTVLSPLSEKYEELNDYSIVLRADYGSDSFLFTGDAEILVENELLAAYDASILDCDVLKVGHHGSNSSSSWNFLKAVTPSIAVIGVGTDNDYGHPKEKVLERFGRFDATIYRTDRDGTVILTTEGRGISVSTEKGQ